MTPNQAAASTANRQGIRVVGRTCEREAEVFSPVCLEFLEELVRRFQPAIDALLARRRVMQARYDAGERPSFLPETTAVREADWTVAPLPGDLVDRRVEITGPVDRKMIINALNSGASVYMADFEDSTAPRWDNIVSGHANLIDAVRGTIAYDDPAAGKSYRLAARTAVLMARPRGWHLQEKHIEVDGHPVPASLVDFGVFFFHNARALVDRGTGPYFYLPKLQGHVEARLWNEVFVHAQSALGLPAGTIRATVLIETLPAAFEMDEILWELRDHVAGLNCGRWDYIFSFIKVHKNDPSAVLPDRSLVTMDQGFLRAYTQLLVKTCHRRRAHAIGGMAAQIPIRNDAAANESAMAKVIADKRREVTSGHDGTWVAHPGLVPLARQIFDAAMPGPNQIHVQSTAIDVRPADLLAVPDGPRTDAGLRWDLRVGILYLEAWLRGTGCVPLYNLMEDAATAEISRAQVWQWLHHRVRLADGREVTPALVREALASEMASVRSECGPFGFEGRKFGEAVGLFERLLFSGSFEDFLTVPAYEYLLDLDRSPQA